MANITPKNGRVILRGWFGNRNQSTGSDGDEDTFNDMKLNGDYDSSMTMSRTSNSTKNDTHVNSMTSPSSHSHNSSDTESSSSQWKEQLTQLGRQVQKNWFLSNGRKSERGTQLQREWSEKNHSNLYQQMEASTRYLDGKPSKTNKTTIHY